MSLNESDISSNRYDKFRYFDEEDDLPLIDDQPEPDVELTSQDSRETSKASPFEILFDFERLNGTARLAFAEMGRSLAAIRLRMMLQAGMVPLLCFFYFSLAIALAVITFVLSQSLLLAVSVFLLSQIIVLALAFFTLKKVKSCIGLDETRKALQELGYEIVSSMER